MKNEQLFKARLRRLNEIVSGNRFNDFSCDEVFELILSYVMDEEGAAVCAQRLAQRFGSVSAAIDAPVDAIREALYGNSKAADFFKLVKTVGSYYRVDKINGGKRFVSIDDIAEYCIHRFSGDNRESFSVLLVDPDMRMLGLETISEGVLCEVSVSYESIADAIFKYGASSFILVHNHPGDVTPSETDFDMTLDILQTFSIFNKRLAEHIIVSNNSYAPIIQMMRSDNRGYRIKA